MNVLQKEKDRLSKDDDFSSVSKKKELRNFTIERQKMIEEERNINHRRRLNKVANDKARRGSEKRQMRESRKATEKIREIHQEQMRLTIERVSAIIIQCHYRGHLGRKVAKRWKSLRSHVLAYNALCHSSAIAITRVFRGHRERKRAANLRKELVDYIISIREAEIMDDEEEYWSNLRFGEWRRKRDLKFRAKAQIKSTPEKSS